MRRLIVCCDGTWNSWDNQDGDVRAPTNVVKFFSEVAEEDAHGVEQRKFYRTGVGTLGNPIQKVVDGAFGTRLENDIQSAYKWLAENYSLGDEIYILGFSRGAFSARSLAGVVGKIGMCDLTSPDLEEPEKWANAKAAVLRYKLAKANGGSWVLNRDKAQGKDRITCALYAPEDVPIRFLGVWDTVGSLGVPDDLALVRRLIGDPRANRFLDTELGSGVQTARHALAIDEKRLDFTPTLWTGVDPDRDVEQAWFPGVHGDVGGSYADHRLGDLTLAWMMDAAKSCGLGFRAGQKKRLNGDPQGLMHDSFKGIFRQRRTRPRSVPSFHSGSREDSYLHASARDRNKDPALGEAHYWNTRELTNVGDRAASWVGAREKWHFSGIYLKAGETYEVKAAGEWRDAHLKGGPDGAYRQRGFAYGLARVPELYRSFLRKRKRTRKADNSLSRRAPGKWFALVGAIANGQGVDDDQNLKGHEMRILGAKDTFSPKMDGYLYCFANDAWRFYGNNSGAVSIEVTRIS